MAYTAKGTPKGYDVNLAIDYLLSFKDSWPLLKVGATGTYTGSVSHNLGYPPFHLLARPAGGFGSADGRIDQLAYNYGVDSSVLSRISGAGSPRYYICRLPLDQNFTAETISGSTTKSGVQDGYVFKISKPGKSVDSSDMRDFAIHSDTRSPMVHMVNHGAMTNTGAGMGFERTVTHGLGYVPLAFVFMKPGPNTSGTLDPQKYGIVEPPIGVGSKWYSVDATSVYVTADSFEFTGTPLVSVVVLKDPFTRETISRTYP